MTEGEYRRSEVRGEGQKAEVGGRKSDARSLKEGSRTGESIALRAMRRAGSAECRKQRAEREERKSWRSFDLRIWRYGGNSVLGFLC